MDHNSITRNLTTQLPHLSLKDLSFFSDDLQLTAAFENLRLTNDGFNGDQHITPILRDKSVLHEQTFKVSEPCGEYQNLPSHYAESGRLYDHIDIISMTKPGSYALQNILADEVPSFTWQILERIIESMFDVMTNKYGHFVFEKLVNLCDDAQLEIIMVKILHNREKFIDAAKNNCGASSVRKLIKAVAKSDRLGYTLVALFSREFYGLMTCQTGSSVILSCLDFLDIKMNDVIYEEAIKNCMNLACDEVGCVSLNKFINHSKGPRREELLCLVSETSVFLAQDPFGNYVLQNVIDLHTPVFTKIICTRLKGHFARLSLQKAGSHVVERCIHSPGRDYVLEEFVNSSILTRLATDQHGNYVLQTALKVAKQAGSLFYRELLDKLKQNSSYLKTGYGKYIYYLIASSSC
ncbi:hypothetical protein ACFE04_006763 [Oxalis oulophora]